MNFKSILSKLFGRKTHPAHEPYIPAPPTPQTQAPPNQNSGPTNTGAAYVEAKSNMASIAGLDVAFGTQNVIMVDNSGHAKDISQTQSHIVGSGKLVTKIEDIAGVCTFCQATAAEQFQAGQISLQQAHSMSLYDKGSAAICSACGFQGCLSHVRPIQTEQGVLTICGTCQNKIEKQLRRRRIIGFLLAPISETENTEES